MKKRVIAAFLSVMMTASLLAGCGQSSKSETKEESKGWQEADYTGEDPQLEKTIKILSIWAEDNDNGILLSKICQDYKDNVNPNFDWEYEMVSADNLTQKIATLSASNDLPDMFAYEAGAPLRTLIDSDKVANVSEIVDKLDVSSSLNEGAVELLKGLSGTDDMYDLPLGLNVEGFWYNKALFEKAGCEVPSTWEEFEAVLEKLDAAGIQPLATGGSDKWSATRLVNAYAVRTMGNDVMTKAADGDIEYTDEGLVAAADKLASWADNGYFGEGITTVDTETAGSMLMSGKAAIFYNGSWFTQNLTDPAQNPAGEDGIGFFNIPIEDESISSATSYSMNCGNILAFDQGKVDEGTAWFLKYFIENMGDVAMEELGTVKGYTYSIQPDDMDPYTKLVLDEIENSTEGFAWWEAKMGSEISKTAQENVQPLLNGEMTGEEYMGSIQDVYEMNK
jgi:raffinose/stachyose/melibiose transport system substrate-binding protein